MQLSKIQRRALLRGKELRGKPFPVVGSMLRSWKTYLFLSALLGGYSLFAWSMGLVEVGVGSLGVLIGMVARDIALLRLNARMWPVNVEITDWTKVDKLLGEKNET